MTGVRRRGEEGQRIVRCIPSGLTSPARSASVHSFLRARTARASIPGCGRPSGSPGHPGGGTGWSLSDPTEIAFYIRAGPRRTTLTELATIAGSRWRVEDFQQAKDQAGLEQYQVRHLPSLVRPHHLVDARPRVWLAGTKTEATKEESG
jgi:hypothetical protein